MAGLILGVQAPASIGLPYWPEDATTDWQFYNRAKQYLMDGTIDLDGHTFAIALYTSASNANTATLVTRASLTNEVANGNGYVTAGQTLNSVTWATGTSAAQQKFTAAAAHWAASGGAIADIRYAVLWDVTTSKVMMRVPISAAQFSLPSGNTFDLQPPSLGLFTLR